ncbi:MAG TPA: NAD(P)/FAD-dependent oxidoreductase [Acidimicrobiales bacterium]|nr:NAD(P)/FAD-dependent oxidoreductase [Acidimicrobiales bacterium]
MTMFDYDARPVTPQLLLIGTRSSAGAYDIRDFLTRNGRPYEWVDVEDLEEGTRLPQGIEIEARLLPICVLPDGTKLAPATLEQVAAGLGMVSAPSQAEYDLAIVGAGPAGLASAVYATSEGLSTVVVEAVAPGGQAGTTSMIENYLGFPNGISGNELATRAATQATHFGAEILLARRSVRVSPDRAGYTTELSDGTLVSSRTLIFASGVEWRRLEVPGIEDLLGAGVYYGAGPSEALGCRGSHVVVVGGGNSAGQAAVRFSKYAQNVTLLVRGGQLSSSMSRYLVDQISSASNIEVRTGSEVTGLDGDGELCGVVVSSREGGVKDLLPADSLFICIGGTPRTEGASNAGLQTDDGGYLLTGDDVLTHAGRPGAWPLERQPLPLETNLPGVFAAGDVRHGSIKRCAAAIGEGAMAVALVHHRLAEDADD